MLIRGFLVILLSLFTSFESQANSPCNSVDECTALKVQVRERIAELLATSNLNMGIVIRDNDGYPKPLTYDEAVQACAASGSSLPSARDFAAYSAAFGAKGIRETAYPNTPISDQAVLAEQGQMAADEYYGVFSKNVNDEPVVLFYYNHIGGRYEDREFDQKSFWTSTPAMNTSEGPSILAFFSRTVRQYFYLESISNIEAKHLTYCAKTTSKKIQTKSNTPVCDTLLNCSLLGTEIDNQKFELSLAQYGFGPYSGFKTWDQADAFCKSQGGRLPSFRDYAFGYATASGALAADTQYPNTDLSDPGLAAEMTAMQAQGYEAETDIVADDKTVVLFYLNKQRFTWGTMHSDFDMQNDVYWTSDTSPIDPNLRGGYGPVDNYFWWLSGNEVRRTRCIL